MARALTARSPALFRRTIGTLSGFVRPDRRQVIGSARQMWPRWTIVDLCAGVLLNGAYMPAFLATAFGEATGVEVILWALASKAGLMISINLCPIADSYLWRWRIPITRKRLTIASAMLQFALFGAAAVTPITGAMFVLILIAAAAPAGWLLAIQMTQDQGGESVRTTRDGQVRLNRRGEPLTWAGWAAGAGQCWLFVPVGALALVFGYMLLSTGPRSLVAVKFVVALQAVLAALAGALLAAVLVPDPPDRAREPLGLRRWAALIEVAREPRSRVYGRAYFLSGATVALMEVFSLIFLQRDLGDTVLTSNRLFMLTSYLGCVGGLVAGPLASARPRATLRAGTAISVVGFAISFTTTFLGVAAARGGTYVGSGLLEIGTSMSATAIMVALVARRDARDDARRSVATTFRFFGQLVASAVGDRPVYLLGGFGAVCALGAAIGITLVGMTRSPWFRYDIPVRITPCGPDVRLQRRAGPGGRAQLRIISAGRVTTVDIADGMPILLSGTTPLGGLPDAGRLEMPLRFRSMRRWRRRVSCVVQGETAGRFVSRAGPAPITGVGIGPAIHEEPLPSVRELAAAARALPGRAWKLTRRRARATTGPETIRIPTITRHVAALGASAALALGALAVVAVAAARAMADGGAMGLGTAGACAAASAIAGAAAWRGVTLANALLELRAITRRANEALRLPGRAHVALARKLYVGFTGRGRRPAVLATVDIANSTVDHDTPKALLMAALGSGVDVTVVWVHWRRNVMTTDIAAGTSLARELTLRRAQWARALRGAREHRRRPRAVAAAEWRGVWRILVASLALGVRPELGRFDPAVLSAVAERIFQELDGSPGNLLAAQVTQASGGLVTLTYRARRADGRAEVLALSAGRRELRVELVSDSPLILCEAGLPAQRRWRRATLATA